jgi:hypothetical protein
MNKNNDFEMISALLDDELPQNQQKELEKRIDSSDVLKKKLEEYGNLKSILANTKKIPEAPFFETRLMAKLKEKDNSRFSLKKLYPVFGIAMLTIAFMFIFKFNQNGIDSIVEKQKSKIIDIYTQNLKPILFDNQLTKEDIFNFAFYNSLPLDKNNRQYLSLGTEQNGNGYLEIKTASLLPETNNLEKFMSSLRLNTSERKQVDSILEGYIEEIKPQILVNSNNTLAINSNLWNYNKAIAADLMNFAKRVNNSTLKEIMPASYNLDQMPSVSKIISNVKNNNNDTYIFITPDTIFSEQFKFDMNSFTKKMDALQKSLNNMQNQSGALAKQHIQLPKDVIANMNKEIRKLQKLNKDMSKNNKFRVQLDSNYYKVQIPKVEIPDFEMPDFDSIIAKIAEEARRFRNYSFSYPNDGYQKDEKGNKKDQDKNYRNRLKMPFFDQNIAKELQQIDSIRKYGFDNLSFLPDSLNKMFESFRSDSMNVKDLKTLKGQMRSFKEEMKNLQKQMERYREEMQNSKPGRKEIKKKTPVEVKTKRHYYIDRQIIV